MYAGAVQMALMNDGDYVYTMLGANLTVFLGHAVTPVPAAAPISQDALSEDAVSPGPLPGDSVPEDTSLEPDTVPALTSLGVDPAAGATVLKSQPASTAGSTGSVGAAPAPGPAGNILRKIFKAEPRCVCCLPAAHFFAAVPGRTCPCLCISSVKKKRPTLMLPLNMTGCIACPLSQQLLKRCPRP